MVTGLGAVAPNGVGVPEFTRALRAGRSGVGLVELRREGATKDLKTTVAAACGSFDPASSVDDADARRLPRLIPMALSAAREALAACGLLPALGGGEADIARRVGLVLGTGGGGIDFTAQQFEAAVNGRRPSLWTITNATHGNLAGELSIRLGLRGPSLCVSTGCASSSDAAALALDKLRLARPASPDVWVVVGADAHIRPDVLLGMELLKVISPRDWRTDPARAHTASRPFDARRDGFVLGEGAWAMVLERPGFAAARGVRPLGALLGAAATCDAFHRVRPDPDMTECSRAMRGALDDAGLRERDVDLVHYHGTATPVNDELETRAVKLALGDRSRGVRGTSVKSMIGHPQGACGMAAVVSTLAALTGADGGGPFVPPTINLEERDPACDLDYTPNRAAPLEGSRPHVALVNCLAFGAKNTALVLRA